MNVTLLEEVSRLSMDERIQLVTAIWDSVAEDAGVDCLPLPDSHRSVLDERLEDRRQHPDDESSWDDVVERLRNR